MEGWEGWRVSDKGTVFSVGRNKVMGESTEEEEEAAAEWNRQASNATRVSPPPAWQGHRRRHRVRNLSFNPPPQPRGDVHWKGRRIFKTTCLSKKRKKNKKHQRQHQNG